MKKIFLCLSLFCIFASFSFADTSILAKHIRAVGVIADEQNLSSREATWVPNDVAQRLESNIGAYTNLTLVDIANKQEIRRLQAESEGDEYDERTAIEAGKLANASHIITLTVKQISGKYGVTISLVDLTTGTKDTYQSKKSVKTLEELYLTPGCVIDLLFIEICDRIGVSLTPTERIRLQYGDDSLSDTERSRITDEEIKNIEQRKRELDKEISLLRNKTNAEDIAAQKRLEAERALQDEKLRKAQEDKLRQAAEEKRREEDEKKNRERSEAQKQKINEVSESLQDTINQIREEKMKEVSILGQINQIESIKKIYVDINQEIESVELDLSMDARIKINEMKKEVQNRPLENSEMVDNHITAQAQENRQKEISIKKKKIETQLEKDIKSFRDGVKKDQANLLKEIKKGYSNLKKRTITTLNDELVVDFGNYNGNDCYWPLKVTVQSDGLILFTTNSVLSYRDLTGKKPVTVYGEKGFDEYKETVDFYVAMFSRNEPYLTFALDYDVEPLSEENPSKYKFSFSNFRFYETSKLKVSGNKIRSIAEMSDMHLDDTTIERQMIPIYDLRDLDKQREAFVREKERKEREEEIIAKTEEVKENISRTTEELIYNFKTRDWGRTQASFIVGVYDDDVVFSFGVKGEVSVGILPWLYANYRAEYYGLVDDKKGYFNANKGGNNIFNNTIGVGLNYKIASVELFTDYGLGFNMYKPIGYQNDEKRFEFIQNLSIGGSYIFANHLTGTLGVSIIMIPDYVAKKHGSNFTDWYYNAGVDFGVGVRL